MIQGDAKVIEVVYSSDESIKDVLTGVDVVISTAAIAALDIQVKIAAAAKNAEVKLFVPSEYNGRRYGGASRDESKSSRPAESFELAIRRLLHGKVPGFRLVVVRLFVYFNN